VRKTREKAVLQKTGHVLTNRMAQEKAILNLGAV